MNENENQDLFFVSKEELLKAQWSAVFAQLNSVTKVRKFIKGVMGALDIPPSDLDSTIREAGFRCDEGIGINEKGQVRIF